MKNVTFEQFIKLVDCIIRHNTGMSLDDLPDIALCEYFEEGMSLEQAKTWAREASEAVIYDAMY